MVKLRSAKLEIYPSIMLPSGPQVSNTKIAVLEFQKNEIWGIKSGEEFEVNLKEIFNGIPEQYYPYFYSTEFGTKPVESSMILWGHFLLIYILGLAWITLL
ncbi:hypothetical protein DN752_21040 [Echinicola strongylocentroti]|uniref:Uncharacterized protein n=2 Tax=Echinicola strongylocentroti TaxID=1795355 RepID=A0A2Z4INU5_9BACT|nr:hypothetical protein DN752_21040 [Echinicola strongylocentroti]